MKVTIEMLTFAVKTYPTATPIMLEIAAGNTAAEGQDDYTCYCQSLAEAFIDLAPTITVSDSFGNDKAISKADYILRWADHTKELRSLAPSLTEKRLQSILKEISNAAAAEFDRIKQYEEETAAVDKAA